MSCLGGFSTVRSKAAISFGILKIIIIIYKNIPELRYFCSQIPREDSFDFVRQTIFKLHSNILLNLATRDQNVTHQ